jgi:hypothetical protein
LKAEFTHLVSVQLYAKVTDACASW